MQVAIRSGTIALTHGLKLYLIWFPRSMLAPLWQSVRDLTEGETLLRQRRFGVIEMQAGKLIRIGLRPLPKLISVWEVNWLGGRTHRHTTGDRCWLYYNQPWGSPNYLALQYLVSSGDCTLATVRGALAILEHIARLKDSLALVCQGNALFSDRLPIRWGWEPHLLDFPGKHFIKRFYGDFSSIPPLERYVHSS